NARVGRADVVRQEDNMVGLVGSRRVAARVRSVVVGAVLACAVTSPAYAAINGFEGGDGNQAGDCSASVTDWVCVPDAALNVAGDASGAGEDVFAGGQEATPNGWSYTTGGNVPGKADLTGAWTLTQNNPDGHTYLDLAFTRADATGNTYLGLELN